MNGLDKKVGSSLFSRVRGDEANPPIVILHGLFGSSDNLANIASLLSDDYFTHALDLRNHGRSFHSDTMDYSAMAGDVIRYIEGNKLSNVVIVGHSMGGKVAMSLALEYPDLVKTIIVADISPVQYPPHHSEILKGLSLLYETKLLSRNDADELLKEFVEEPGVRQFLLKNLKYNDQKELDLKLNMPSILENYNNIMAGQTLHKRKYSKPVLFIAGGDSDYIKPEHREIVQSLFEDIQFKVIPGASHWLHAEKPDMFVRICKRFLKQC